MNQVPLQSCIIAWFVHNPVAANLLMITIILLGIFAFSDLRKEAFPSRPADTVTVSVTYKSGNPMLSEEGIAIKVEEAIANVPGIKRITSTSTSHAAVVSIEMKSGYDLNTLLRDVKTKVDAIHNFPVDAEKPVISKQQRLHHAYSVKLYGEGDRKSFQNLAEQIKTDLLIESGITEVEIKGSAEPMLSIEVDEKQLQAFGLTLSDVAIQHTQKGNISIVQKQDTIEIENPLMSNQTGKEIQEETGFGLGLKLCVKLSQVFDYQITQTKTNTYNVTVSFNGTR